MKLKTSCFNTTIFKKNITLYWPLWAGYLCYLMIAMPVNIWLTVSQSNYYEWYESDEVSFYAVGSGLNVGLLPFPVFLVAVVVAMAVFSYLCSAKNANMIHSFPVDRRQLFVTNYTSGLLFLLAPEIITFVISVLVCVANQVTCIQYLFLWLLYVAGMSFFAYSLAVFAVMLTGQLVAAPVYCFMINYLYVGCLSIVCSLVETLNYGIYNYFDPGSFCILSPIYYLGNHFGMKYTYAQNGETVDGIEIYGGYLIGIYAVAAVVIMVAAYQLYKRRKLETAGDMVSVGILKPVFRWGAAFGGGFLLALWCTSLLNSYIGNGNMVDAYPVMVACAIVFGFLCFFFAEMLQQKKFRVFRKKRVLEWGVFALISVGVLTLFELDAFGIERYVPESEEIEMAFVYMDYPIALSGEQLSELLELHQQIIEDKDAYLENAKNVSGYYYTTIRYYMNDGSTVERRYPLPLTEEYLEDASSPTAKILEWENDPDWLKRRILGMSYEECDHYWSYIDVYDEDGTCYNYYFNEDEMERLVSAIELDIEEGNFSQYCIYSTSQDTETYYNGICLEYINKSGDCDIWDYYYNYREYAGTAVSAGTAYTTVGVSYTSTYIAFGPDCVHVVETLSELGVIDDTWKLLTDEEYEQYTEY